MNIPSTLRPRNSIPIISNVKLIKKMTNRDLKIRKIKYEKERLKERPQTNENCQRKIWNELYQRNKNHQYSESLKSY